MPIVTLLTDYGTRDHYVAALKGVILGIAPDARLVDITHEIEPHNVGQAAFVLRQIWPWFPAGTVHLAVVDPGVGTDRRIILAKYASSFVVAPDNGLVTLVHREFSAEAVHVVEDRRNFLPVLSTTFHGRDIMAPVAARVASGAQLRKFGRATNRLEMLPLQYRAKVTGSIIIGSVLYVDRFGTLITNIHSDQLVDSTGQSVVGEVAIGEKALGGLQACFADVPVGCALALIGGSGLLEIAVNQGRASDLFSSTCEVRVELR